MYGRRTSRYPARRYRSKRKRTYRRKPRNNLYKDVRRLKSLVHPEFKYITYTIARQPDDGTAGNTPILLNGMQKGDDVTDREGRQVFIKSLQLMLKYTMHASATNTVVRTIVFLDKMPHAATPNFTDVINGETPTDLKNVPNSRRFWIIKDFNLQLCVNAYSEKTIKNYRKLNIKTTYDNSNSGDIQDISVNALYIMFCSDEDTNLPNVDGEARIRFLDA